MMRGMPLPQHPVRVRVTLADATVGGWLIRRRRRSAEQRWRLVDDRAAAGVWEWSRALELEREARQPWRRQYATAERVNPGPPAPDVWRADLGDQARAIAAACGIPDAGRSCGCRTGATGRCSATTTTGIRHVAADRRGRLSHGRTT
jgi:hypothetical protein